VLLASNNPGKLQEMQAILRENGLRWTTPEEAGIDLEIEEDGQTYAENAAKKALAFAQRSGRLSLADDSGLEVAALQGAPGLYSHRFAPQPEATDADRRAYLLARLRGHPRPWLARFHCTVAVATPAGEVYFREGECPGEITPQEYGLSGFGYDPVFLVQGLDRTMAELDPAKKNQVSHRARAMRAAVPLLRELLSSNL
jgi:XTP/dITP diphosphohydrolase